MHFQQKKFLHWKSEYEIDYWISSVCNGKIVNKNSIWIVEACSLGEAKSNIFLATKQFRD